MVVPLGQDRDYLAIDAKALIEYVQQNDNSVPITEVVERFSQKSKSPESVVRSLVWELLARRKLTLDSAFKLAVGRQ